MSRACRRPRSGATRRRSATCWRRRRGLEEFALICEREMLPVRLVVRTNGEKQLVVADRHFGNKPVDMDSGRVAR